MDTSGEEKTTSQEKWWTWLYQEEKKGPPRWRWIDNTWEDMKQIWYGSWHDWKQTVLENDGEYWPTKMASRRDIIKKLTKKVKNTLWHYT